MARRFARILRAVSCPLAALLLFAGCALQPLGAQSELVFEALFSPAFQAPEALEQPDYVDFSVSRFLYGDLNETQRQAYRAIHNAAVSQPERIRLPSLTEEELSAVLLAVKGDNPYLVCFSTAYSFVRLGGYYALEPQYTDGPAGSRARAAALVAAAKDLVSDCDPSAAPFEKELFSHDALCTRCVYAEGPGSATAYGALVEGRAVCEGYALAQKLLLDLLGVQSVAVQGEAAETGETPAPHMWNAALLDTGWYFLDCTWDDPVLADGGEYVRHAYFNVDAETLDRTHGGYTLPADIVCDGEASQYFRKKKLFCTASNWEAVIREAVSDAADGTSAEFRFENEALLSEVTARLFTDGGLAQMIPAELENCRWAAQEDALTLQIRFVGAQRNE